MGRQIAAAELEAGPVEVARLKREAANEDLDQSKMRFDQGIISSEEFDRAKFAREQAALDYLQALRDTGTPASENPG